MINGVKLLRGFYNSFHRLLNPIQRRGLAKYKGVQIDIIASIDRVRRIVHGVAIFIA